MVRCYVDGCYDVHTGEYGYGVVVVGGDNEVLLMDSFRGDPKNAQYRNVAGEVEAAIWALNYCYCHYIPEVTLYADYEGIIKWCTGEWKCKNPLTKGYKDFYDHVSQDMKVNFVKVKSHSGDYYNELADKLAKRGAGKL